jgi:hypothetical protein
MIAKKVLPHPRPGTRSAAWPDSAAQSRLWAAGPVEGCPGGAGGGVAVDAPVGGQGSDDVEAVVSGLDGPTGPTTASPGWATLDLLIAAIAQAANVVRVDMPTVPGLSARTLAWGRWRFGRRG